MWLEHAAKSEAMQNQAPEQSAAALAQLTASQPEVSHGGGILGDRSSAHINIRNLRVCILTLQGGGKPQSCASVTVLSHTAPATSTAAA